MRGSGGFTWDGTDRGMENNDQSFGVKGGGKGTYAYGRLTTVAEVQDFVVSQCVDKFSRITEDAIDDGDIVLVKGCHQDHHFDLEVEGTRGSCCHFSCRDCTLVSEGRFKANCEAIWN